MRIPRFITILALSAFAACGQDNLLGPLGSEPTPAEPAAAQPAEVSADVTPGTGPTVVTDKADYMPGETAQITGSGFGASEDVTIYLFENPHTHDITPWIVTTDGQGGFTTSYLIEDHDLGVRFHLEAIGTTSGLIASADFSDNISIDWVTLNGTQLDCTGSVFGGTYGCTSVSVTGGATIAVDVQADTWYFFFGNGYWKSTEYEIEGQSPVCVPFPGGPTTPTSNVHHTFNITAPAVVGNYDLSIRVNDSADCSGSDEDNVDAYDDVHIHFGPFNYDYIVSAIHVTSAGSVNQPPDLTAPSNQTTPWGNQVSFTATATDPDVGDQLTYSLGSTPSPPSGAAINGTSGAFTWTPGMSDIGSHTIQVCVTDDGTPPMSDCETFNVDVGKRATMLVYGGDTSGQWSSDASLSATLTDNSGGSMQGGGISGKTVGFTLGSQSTSGSTNGSGVATATLNLTQVPGSYTMASSFAGDSYYLSSSDSDPFSIGQRPTALVYGGSTNGQYSDDATLSATLTDAGTGSANGSALENKTIGFTLGSQSTSASTNASGVASTDLTITQPAANTTIVSSFAGDTYYASSGDSDPFKIWAEHTTILEGSDNPSAISLPGGGATSFDLDFSVKEANPEPNPQDGAHAGNIALLSLSAQLSPVGGGGNIIGSCVDAVTGSGYSAMNAFTCSFSGVPVEAYTVEVAIGAYAGDGGAYYKGMYESALTVYDPDAGFPSGGGRILLDGDNLTWGVGFGQAGRKKLKGNIVAVRHFADGGFCRTKSQDLGAAAISGNVATFAGKANYVCVDGDGNEYDGKGNLNLTGYMEDVQEPGKGFDRFWVSVYGAILMPAPASANAEVLVGGNVQVPHLTGHNR